jgi:hypothetical protein
MHLDDRRDYASAAACSFNQAIDSPAPLSLSCSLSASVDLNLRPWPAKCKPSISPAVGLTDASVALLLPVVHLILWLGRSYGSECFTREH